MNKIKPKLN